MSTCKTNRVNYLSLDYGDKNVGVAIAREGVMALGIKILANDKNLIGNIQSLAESEDVDVVVVGLPVKLDGAESAQTRKTQEFIETLRNNLSKVKIETSDEKMSTLEAARNLTDRKQKKDAEAARIILQGHLDNKVQRAKVQSKK